MGSKKDFTQDLVEKTFHEQNMKWNIRNKTFLFSWVSDTKALDGVLSGSSVCVGVWIQVSYPQSKTMVGL